MSMSDPKPTFSYLIETIKSRHPKFAYVHLTEPVVAGDKTKTPSNEDGSNDFAKAIWLPRPLFLAGGLSADRAKEMAEEEGVVPVFGRYFISNVSFHFEKECYGPWAEPLRSPICPRGYVRVSSSRPITARRSIRQDRTSQKDTQTMRLLLTARCNRRQRNPR